MKFSPLFKLAANWIFCLKIKTYLSMFSSNLHFKNSVLQFSLPKITMKFIHRISNQILIPFDVWLQQVQRNYFRTETNMLYKRTRQILYHSPAGSFPLFFPSSVFFEKHHINITCLLPKKIYQNNGKKKFWSLIWGNVK